MLVFTVGNRTTPDPRKDTLRNITTAREFVVNVVSEEIGAKMNLCSGDYPPDSGRVRSSPASLLSRAIS